MLNLECPLCKRAVQLDDSTAGTVVNCPLCAAQFAVPRLPGGATGSPAGSTPRPGAKTSGWAIASLICGLLGWCTFITAIPAIIFGIVGIRQVNRSGGAVKGMGLAIAGLILGGIVILLIPVSVAILLPNITGAVDSAKRMACANNLKNIGQGIKSYTSVHRGRWPSVYSLPRGLPGASASDDASRIAGQAWGGSAGWDTTFQLQDRGAAPDVAQKDHPPFTCNLSSWWLLVRDGHVMPGLFICPSTDMEADLNDEPSRWWSFASLDNVGYSYANQLGRNTTDNADPDLIVAADRNPMRDDVTARPKGRNVPANEWEWNSPNHGFKGQNVLYVDTRVEWKADPACGIGGNNIWLRSAKDAATGKWTDDEQSYDDKASTVGHQDDTFLVP